MNIPKHLQHPDMTDERRKFIEERVNECRNRMSKVPAFATTKEAIARSVEMTHAEQYSFPSVWKEPKDIGTKHAVVHRALREKAYNAGYTEEVNEQRIFDLANGIKRDEPDEIEEVE